jgi:hypothetical protein
MRGQICATGLLSQAPPEVSAVPAFLAMDLHGKPIPRISRIPFRKRRISAIGTIVSGVREYARFLSILS